MSSNAFEEDIRKSLKVGMNAHVAKPVDIELLFGVMQDLLKKRICPTATSLLMEDDL